MSWVSDLVGNFWFWLIGVPAVCAAAYGAWERHLKHKERMAMIERGINPDAIEKPQKADA